MFWTPVLLVCGHHLILFVSVADGFYDAMWGLYTPILTLCGRMFVVAMFMHLVMVH